MKTRFVLTLVASLAAVTLLSGCSDDEPSKQVPPESVSGYCGFVLADDGLSAGNDLPTVAGGKDLVACMKAALENGEKAVALVAYPDHTDGSTAGVIVNTYRLDGRGGMTLNSARGDDGDGDATCVGPQWLPEIDCS